MSLNLNWLANILSGGLIMTKKPEPKKLTPNEWAKQRAERFRAKSLARARKLKMDIKDVPSRAQIEHWLIDNMQFDSDSISTYAFFQCYITGLRVMLPDAEIDHINGVKNGLGFDNIDITSREFNKIKSDMPLREFMALMDCIAEFSDAGKSVMTRLKRGNMVFVRKS